MNAATRGAADHVAAALRDGVSAGLTLTADPVDEVITVDCRCGAWLAMRPRPWHPAVTAGRLRWFTALHGDCDPTPIEP